MNGTSETEFSPDADVTRGMLVTILHRFEGKPEAGDSKFTDVDADSYYADAIAWAEKNGIVKGLTDKTFGPDDSITREQIATIIHRYAEYKGFDISVGEDFDFSSFLDSENISDYAKEALKYAIASGLIKGKTDSTLNPLDNATRAEIATVFMRFLGAFLGDVSGVTSPQTGDSSLNLVLPVIAIGGCLAVLYKSKKRKTE